MAFLIPLAAGAGGAAVFGAAAVDVAVAGAAMVGIIKYFSETEKPSHAPGVTAADTARAKEARSAATEAAKEAASRTKEAERAKDAAQAAAAARVQEELARAQEMAQKSELKRREAEKAAKAAEDKLRRIEEENRKKEEVKREYPLPNFLAKARKSGKVNIGVTGNSGVGKSSFVNFFRDAKPKDKGYAKVGTMECSTEPCSYALPGGENLWDLPGVGTPSFPQATYIQTFGIRYFDVVLLVTADRFTEAELMLKQEMDQMGVPNLCIRSKADQAWASKITEEAEEAGVEEEDIDKTRKDELKDEMVNSTKDYFNQTYGIADVYLISSKRNHRDDFDFEKLKRDIGIAITNARVSKDCPICFEVFADFGGGAGKRKKAQCGHVWCEACWSKIYQTCPICKANLPS